jgi:hypothetical protein
MVRALEMLTLRERHISSLVQQQKGSHRATNAPVEESRNIYDKKHGQHAQIYLTDELCLVYLHTVMLVNRAGEHRGQRLEFLLHIYARHQCVTS